MGIVSNICRFRVEVEQTPNLDASGNRRTKPDPKFSTRLTAKDLILRLTTCIYCVAYSFTTAIFAIIAQFLCGELVLKIATVPFNHRASHRRINFNKITKILGVLPNHVRSTLLGHSSDFSLHNRYLSRQGFFCQFVLPLVPGLVCLKPQ